jgi:hypothetical protein
MGFDGAFLGGFGWIFWIIILFLVFGGGLI